MGGSASVVRAVAWLALGALVLIYLASYRRDDSPAIVATPVDEPFVAPVAVEPEEREVVAVDVRLSPSGSSVVSGEARIRHLNEVWLWEDGVPIEGSTPARVVLHLSDLEADTFALDGPGDRVQYGLTDPIARATLTDRGGRKRVVLIGAEAEPLADAEGHKLRRYYATIEETGKVFLVEERNLYVLQDLLKERNRKAERDAEKAARRAQGL